MASQEWNLRKYYSATISWRNVVKMLRLPTKYKSRNSLCLPRKTNHTHMHTETRHIQRMLCLPCIKRIAKTHSVPKGSKRHGATISQPNRLRTAVDAIPPICEHTSGHNPTGTLRQVGKKKALPWSFRSIVLHSASTAFGDACSDSLPGCSGSGLVTTAWYMRNFVESSKYVKLL